MTLVHCRKLIRTRIRSGLLPAVFFFFAHSAFASSLYLEPKEINLSRGDTATVEVRIDTAGQCINVVEGIIHYDPTLVKATEFSRGESLLSLWVKPPEIDPEKGIIHFSGGVPGGYCGRAPGDPGLTNLLGRIAFTVPGFSVGMSPMGTGTQSVVDVLPESTVYLNDGRGTKSALTVFGMRIGIVEGVPQGRNDWLQRMRDDKIPPEFFRIEVLSDKSVAAGKSFIVFSTTDKQSGVDHYEVKEADPVRSEFKAGSRQFAVWTPAESPYVLEDQELKSRILVRAIDNAGNMREAELVPPLAYREPVPDRGTRVKFLYLSIIGLILCFVMWRVMVRKRSPKIDDKEGNDEVSTTSLRHPTTPTASVASQVVPTVQTSIPEASQQDGLPPPTRLIITKR